MRRGAIDVISGYAGPGGALTQTWWEVLGVWVSVPGCTRTEGKG